MKRKLSRSVAALAVAGLFTFSLQAKALRVAAPVEVSATQQAMTAEVVVVGKVTEIEKEMTKASAAPGVDNKIDYQVAVIKINDSLQGAKGLTNIRVGFPANGGGGPVPPVLGRPNIR